MKSQLFPHQVEALEGLRQSLARGHSRVMLQAPTAFGKTILAAAIVERAREKGNTVGFIAPFTVLIDQTYDKFVREGVTEVGVMQADHELTDERQPVQVISVDTLRSRVQRQHRKDRKEDEDAPVPYPDFDVVIIDEAHRNSKFIRQWMADKPEQIFVGLSATPWSRGLGNIYTDLVRPVTMDKLIDDGFLSSFRVYAPKAVDLKGVKVSSTGEYDTKELSKLMSDDGLVGEIVETWQKLGNDEPTLVFAVDRLHAQSISQRFEAANISCGYVDGFTKFEDRRDILRKFRTGDIKIIVNVGVYTTGMDEDVRCIVLARPVRSAILHVQIIGRGLRTAEGKSHCLILDLAGNHHRLGFATECGLDKMDTTDRGYVEARAGGKSEPKPCSKCGTLRLPTQKSLACLECGHVPDPQSSLTEKKGELVELTFEQRRAQIREQQRFYSGLVYLGIQRGYKPGWAANAYKKRYGSWPPKYLDREPGPVTEDVKKFDTYLRIKYMKGMGKRRAKA